MSPQVRRALGLLAVPVRLYLGGLLVFAALYKIARPYDFALAVATYQILPLSLVNLFAILVPWVEIGLGAALVLGLWARAASAAAGGLLAVFVAAIASAMLRGLHLSCGCFASQEAAGEIGVATLLRDLAWIALCSYVWLAHDGRYGLDRFLSRPANRRIDA